MIYKVLVGNEHGGAAASSQEIINHFLKEDNFIPIFLCENRFSKQFPVNKVINLNSFEPPILESKNKLIKLFNIIKFFFWSFITTFLLVKQIKKLKIKRIHTTNNHALLICLLAKLFSPDLYIISHWRCIGLASSSKYKFLLNKINKIICISLAVKESLPIALQKKSIIIYDGVNVNDIHENNIINKGKLKKILNIDDNEFLIGTIGSFTTIKCHEFIIDTFIKGKINKKIKVALIGSCPNYESEKYLEYLKEKVKNNDLENNIYFIEDKVIYPPKNYVSDLDLFIGTTWNNGLGEGFGLIYVEAMAASVPVLAIDVGAASEIIKDNENGFLLSYNSTSLFEEKLNTIDFYKLKKNYKELFTSAKQFDINNNLINLKKLYEELSYCN